MAAILFFTFLFIVFYTYIGYGILLFILLKLKKLFGLNNEISKVEDNSILPEVSLVIPAYNEAGFIEKKIQNSLQMSYPVSNLRIILVTDGSTDGTDKIVLQHPECVLYHSAERKGKVAAINRIMPFITTPITIFSDGNTMLNKDAIHEIVKHYRNPMVGGVSGEKKVKTEGDDSLAATEGFYWRYESFLKKMDSDFYTVVGAAGELFSIRTNLYEPVEEDTLLDDFMISLRISKKGYRIIHEPQAIATETPSANLQEERKRKLRISAGGFQSISRLWSLFNIFKHPALTFQYVSHRFLRWAVCPFLLPVIFLVNVYLVAQKPRWYYVLLLCMQIIFYVMALIGFFLAKNRKNPGVFKFPFYFTFMNVNLYGGFFNYLRGRQSVLWSKAERKEQSSD